MRINTLAIFMCFICKIGYSQNRNCILCYDDTCTVSYCTTNFDVFGKNLLIRFSPNPYPLLSKNSVNFYISVVMTNELCYIDSIRFFGNNNEHEKK